VTGVQTCALPISVGRLSTKAAYHCSQQITALDRRVAALLDLKRMDSDSSPFALKRVFTSFVKAAEASWAGEQLSLILLETFEHYTAGELPKVYRGLNQYLVEQGVLEKLPVEMDEREQELEHREFLDLSGKPPMRALAEQLIIDLEGDLAGGLSSTDGKAGPVFMYTGYEARVIRDLAKRYPDLAVPLQAILHRLVDLHPVVKQNYYHPDMLGSWSIKAVLPTIARSEEDRLDYADLEGIKEGMGAAEAYLEAIDPATTPERRAEIDEQLRVYCRQDTEAMVRLVRFLGNTAPD